MTATMDFWSDFLADAPLTPPQRKEWEEWRAAFLAQRARLEALEARLKLLDREQDGEEASFPDLLNRPDFNREVARMLAFDERYGGASSVLYFNIENLDDVRAQYGGDLLASSLHKVAATLALGVRRSDIVGRLAMDEFGVLLPRCENTDAWKKGEALASSLYESLLALWGPSFKPQISYGAYTFREKENLAEGLKQAASDLTKLGKGGE